MLKLWISSGFLRVQIVYTESMLTKRQKQIVDYINSYQGKEGVSPTLEEIAKHLHLSSIGTVHEHLAAIEKRGYLKKEHGHSRSIETIDPSKSGLIRIPLLGSIAAGQPIEAIHENETIAVQRNKIPRSGDVYALRVLGNSMIDENINDGDIVLVKHQATAENGQKVVALLDNSRAALKKYYRENGQIRLQPANKNMEPIIIRNNKDISIQGIVLDIVRSDNEPRIEKIEISKGSRVEKKIPINKIVLGDAIRGLRELPSNSCDVIVIDPPYNIGKDFGNNTDKRELGEYVNWCKAWIDESIRIMRPSGTMFIYGFSEILAYLSVEIPITKRWLIWHYTNKNVASLNFWQRSHEAIICAWKDKPNFNRDSIREPYTEGFLNGAAGKIRKGTAGRFSKGGMETIYKAHEGGALPRDVIKIPALAGGAGMIERWFLCKTCDNVYEPRQLQKHEKHEIIKHPTQKPLELSRKLIRSAMPEKDGIVLVPFVGSGSECAVAKELGQSYVGFELNPDYIKIANKFIASTKFTPKLL